MFSRYVHVLTSLFLLLSLAVSFFCFSFFDAVTIDFARMQFENKIHAVAEIPSLHACCTTPLMNHMELWESLSFGIQPNLDLLFGLFAVAYVAITFPNLFNQVRRQFDVAYIRFKQRKRVYPSERLFDPQRIALARGILHPKTF